jgi:seryl-tRNA synthetase
LSVHDIRVLRERGDELRDAIGRRGKLDVLGPVLDRAAQLERERRELIQATEERKAARNAASQEVARRKQAGEGADELVARARALGEEIGRLERELGEAERSLDAILYELPNVTAPDVPAGGEEANVVVRSWGAPRESAPRPHWEIGADLGLIDLERGAKISGSGFVVFRGAGARLVRALMSFMIDLHASRHGYEEVWVPFVVGERAMVGTGQLPNFEEDMYRLRDDELYLVPTAEVPVTNLYAGEILDGGALPIAHVAYSPCFRREAGSAGKDTRGLLRVHQFDKVELVRFARPEDSVEQHELLTRQAEAVLEALGLPYRVVLLAAGDTGFSSAKTYDLEVWSPGVGKWLEVSSCSNFGDFQARRANIRYRPAQGEKPRFVHTLNGSGLAFPRTIAAILEHYQQADGSVAVPEALRSHLGADALR